MNVPFAPTSMQGSWTKDEVRMRDGSMDDIIFKNKWKGLGEGNLEIER